MGVSGGAQEVTPLELHLTPGMYGDNPSARCSFGSTNVALGGQWSESGGGNKG
jgi:hypothetical protein